jgi:hypothetical protein
MTPENANHTGNNIAWLDAAKPKYGWQLIS